MPLLLYKCPKCESSKELFDDENKSCPKADCGGTLELCKEGNITTAATTNIFQNRHTWYDSIDKRVEWNNNDMKRAEREKQAEQFEKGSKKI